MLVTKYRHPVLTRDVKDTVYERIHYIAEQRGFRILEINGEPDHIHILMEVDAITSCRVGKCFKDTDSKAGKETLWRNTFKEVLLETLFLVRQLFYHDR